jgi:Bacterial Ig-like domain (group 2)
VHRVRVALAIVSVVLTTGCNGKNPAGPSPPAAPTVTGLVITGLDAVLTGVSTTYTATATLSDGTRAVTPEWSSSNTNVASVDSAGHLSGRAHGSTDVTASYAGLTASKTVQVVNNYAGTWEGQYIIRACTDSGDLTNRDGGWCRKGPGRVGTVGGIHLTLVQSGKNLSEITGTVASFPETITGVVTADGRLSLVGGPFAEWDWEGTVILATWQIRAWDTNLSGPGVMTGRWSQDYSSVYFRIGNAKMENEFVTMTQISTSAGPASASQ